MLITKEFVASGRSANGALTKKQLALLGVDWPPKAGWLERIVGQEIPDEKADAFLKMVGITERVERKAQQSSLPPVNWCNAPEPVDIFLYILELQGGHFYVGLTGDVAVRFSQHAAGEGANWTSLHKPMRVIRSINTGTKNAREAAKLEDMVTVELMLRHGTERIRGGCYCQCDQQATDQLLRSHGHWQSIKAKQYSAIDLTSDQSWDEAIQHFLNTARAYYVEGFPPEKVESVFLALFKLTQYRFWRESFEPCLHWGFWGKKGVLKTLLTFKENQPIGFKFKYPFEVLALALQKGVNHPLPRLALIAWDAYCPSMTESQAKTLTIKRKCFEDLSGADRRYDDFLSILIPGIRHRLRRET